MQRQIPSYDNYKIITPSKKKVYVEYELINSDAATIEFKTKIMEAFGVNVADMLYDTMKKITIKSLKHARHAKHGKVVILATGFRKYDSRAVAAVLTTDTQIVILHLSELDISETLCDASEAGSIFNTALQILDKKQAASPKKRIISDSDEADDGVKKPDGAKKPRIDDDYKPDIIEIKQGMQTILQEIQKLKTNYSDVLSTILPLICKK